MRYRTRQIELEAFRFEGKSVPEFAIGKTSSIAGSDDIRVETDEGPRECGIGDYLVLTDNGQLLVRKGAIFEAVFEPVQ